MILNGMFGAYELIIILVIFGLLILPLLGWWKIFEKAGKPGWASIVPIYNIIVMLEIIGKPWWWLLLMMIPYVGIIWYIWSLNLTSKSFGKTESFTVGLVLLGIIFIPVLGFGDAKYIGPAGNNQNI
jgi:hypothetical protein